MNARTGVAAVAFTLALAACASNPFSSAARCEGPGVCRIQVRVADCVPAVVPDALHVFGHNHEIHWDIVDSPGYAFDDAGIEFKDDPAGEFADGHRPQPTKYIVHDKNSFASDEPYRYGLRLLKDGAQCPPTDPGIINHG
jgi:hypothetical protein